MRVLFHCATYVDEAIKMFGILIFFPFTPYLARDEEFLMVCSFCDVICVLCVLHYFLILCMLIYEAQQRFVVWSTPHR